MTGVRVLRSHPAPGAIVPFSVAHESTRVRHVEVDHIDRVDISGRPAVVVVMKSGHWVVLDPEVAQGIAEAMASRAR